MIGTDIQENQKSENRGDRYASNMIIMENLRQANYPGFCFAKDYSANSNGTVTGAQAKTYMPGAASGSLIQTSPVEMLRWTDLRFMPKNDNQKSGLIYGAASVELYARSNVLPAIA